MQLDASASALLPHPSRPGCALAGLTDGRVQLLCGGGGGGDGAQRPLRRLYEYAGHGGAWVGALAALGGARFASADDGGSVHIWEERAAVALAAAAPAARGPRWGVSGWGQPRGPGAERAALSPADRGGAPGAPGGGGEHARWFVWLRPRGSKAGRLDRDGVPAAPGGRLPDSVEAAYSSGEVTGV